MHLSAIVACVLAAASSTAALPLGEKNTNHIARQEHEILFRDVELDARQLDPITLSIITAAAGAAGTWATTQALDGIKSLVSSAANWDSAREAFTKATVDKLMASISADASYQGAVCYNMGYDISDASKISAVTTVNFKSGVLKTDYDCFYMKSGAKFTAKGDGGFINKACYKQHKWGLPLRLKVPFGYVQLIGTQGASKQLSLDFLWLCREDTIFKLRGDILVAKIISTVAVTRTIGQIVS